MHCWINSLPCLEVRDQHKPKHPTSKDYPYINVLALLKTIVLQLANSQCHKHFCRLTRKKLKRNYGRLTSQAHPPPFTKKILQETQKEKRKEEFQKNSTVSRFVCHPCAGAMLISTASFQFYSTYPRRLPNYYSPPYKMNNSSRKLRCRIDA